MRKGNSTKLPGLDGETIPPTPLEHLRMLRRNKTNPSKKDTEPGTNNQQNDIESSCIIPLPIPVVNDYQVSREMPCTCDCGFDATKGQASDPLTSWRPSSTLPSCPRTGGSAWWAGFFRENNAPLRKFHVLSRSDFCSWQGSVTQEYRGSSEERQRRLRRKGPGKGYGIFGAGH